MATSKKLTKFLIDLSNNPADLERFKRDPKGHLDATDLSPDEKSVILSADPAKIRQAISGDVVAGDVVVVVVVVVA
jgi:hypothetical protein